MEVVGTFILNSINELAVKIIGLSLTMTVFAVMMFFITGIIKTTPEFRKGLIVLSSLVGVIVWIEFLYA